MKKHFFETELCFLLLLYSPINHPTTPSDLPCVPSEGPRAAATVQCYLHPYIINNLMPHIIIYQSQRPSLCRVHFADNTFEGHLLVMEFFLDYCTGTLT